MWTPTTRTIIMSTNLDDCADRTSDINSANASTDLRRNSIAGSHSVSNESKSLKGFHKLPHTVIDRILYLADANSFASLSLLNRKWRRISNSASLYRHHLSNYYCLDSLGEISDDLEELKRKFAHVARNYIFEVFLRPKQTVVKLISASASSSSAFPQGEALRFTFSTNGRLLLCLSSSRIFVVDLSPETILVRHELKILRRPIAATILDDGTLLAVASLEHRVLVYQIVEEQATLVQTIEVNEIPRTLTFSPSASVLAVAFDGGIGIYAIGENTLSTAHRSVGCCGVSSLSFSPDGLMLLGSSTNVQVSSFVTISPPLLDPISELSLSELHSRMWTTQILFPEVKEGYSYVNLIPSAGNDDDTVCFVGYDSNSKAFRICQVDDINGGTLYFVGPGESEERNEPGPYIPPTSSEKGEFLAVGYEDSGIWIYRVPNSRIGNLSSRELQELAQPQVNVRRIDENTCLSVMATNFQRLNKSIEGSKHLITGYPLDSISDISDMSWIRNPEGDGNASRKLCRLVAVAPGGVDSSFSIMDEHMPVDGGRVILFDFERSPRNGERIEREIELGETTPIELPENGTTLDVEVELERRRTHVNRRRGLGTRRNVLGHSATQSRRGRSNNIPFSLSRQVDASPTAPLLPGEINNLLPLLDNPYSNTSTRSSDTLGRAATAASRRLATNLSANARPAIGTQRRQYMVPHESDADNWVPPPPPYTTDAEIPLPEDLRRALVPNASDPLSRSSSRNFRSRSLRRSLSSQFDSMVHTPFHGPGAETDQTDISMRSIPTRTLSNRSNSEPDMFRAADGPFNDPDSTRFNTYRNGYANNPVTNSNTCAPTLSSPHLEPGATPMQTTPPSVIGRHGPSHHLVEQPDSQRNPRNMPNTTRATNEPHHAETRISTMEPHTDEGSFYTPSAPRVIHPSTIPSLVPQVPGQLQAPGILSPLDNSLSPATPSHNLRSNRLLDPSNSNTSRRNAGVERSRSRSQDVPHRRPLVSGIGIFDKRTGRRFLSSQSELSLTTNTRSDEWKEQWNRNSGDRKRAKCVVM